MAIFLLSSQTETPILLDPRSKPNNLELLSNLSFQGINCDHIVIFRLNDSFQYSYHMTIDLKTVKHISKLSRISIDDNKAKKLSDDLNSIFKFIEKLEELDTEKIEPLTSIAETNLKLRKDEIKSKNIREDILKNSPEDSKDFFVVPKVVE